jgi:hypothetical protein
LQQLDLGAVPVDREKVKIAVDDERIKTFELIDDEDQVTLRFAAPVALKAGQRLDIKMS